MDRDPGVSLDAFREGLLEEYRADAATRTAAAEREASRSLDEARQEADRTLEKARGEGMEVAERESRRERGELHRQAREEVLRARKWALDRLRERALARLRDRRDTPEFASFLTRMERLAREALPDAEIRRDPTDGGFTAHVEGRMVDYRLEVLVDRVLGEMGSEIEELWT